MKCMRLILSHWCHNKNVKLESFEKNLTDKREGLWEIWSGRRDSNPRLQPWQGCCVPMSRFLVPFFLDDYIPFFVANMNQ
jgi:hypothetical protein